MAHRGSIRMNLQWSSSPVTCSLRQGRHKRLDPDDRPPAAKCPRLSIVSEPGDPHTGFIYGSPQPASPTTPTSPRTPNPHQGPSRIGQFLLLPQLERESSHSAINTETGEELLCKVYDMGVYQEKIRAYGILPAHRNLAGIRELILGERKAYVFLEKDFGDMHTLVKSCRRLDEDRARRLFQQVARAVRHCHQNGVVLGDLKLRKFVFADEKRTQVRLECLEDCRVLENPKNDSMSDTHGCPAYVSPEILSGSTPYSGKMADMWSLGVMLYTMLVGRYPFHDPDPATLFSKIRRGQCCVPEGLSPKAKCLLQSLLRREPAERLTAAELLAHPWFHQPPSLQEVLPTEQEVSSAEQTVPSFEVQRDNDLFC